MIFTGEEHSVGGDGAETNRLLHESLKTICVQTTRHHAPAWTIDRSLQRKLRILALIERNEVVDD